MVGAASDLRVEAYHDYDEALGLASAGNRGLAGAALSPEAWEDLLSRAATNVVFLTWQWQRTWWRHFGGAEGCRLHLLALRARGGALVGVAPLFVANEPIPPFTEYTPETPRPDPEGSPKRVVQLVGGSQVADYLDLIAAPEDLEAAWRAVIDYLLQQRDEWEVIDIHSLPERSPSREIVARVGPERGLRFEVIREDVCPVVDLPPDWDTYLMSLRKKDRHELRRKVRKLEGMDDVRWRLVPPTDGAKLTEGMATFLDLHRQSGSEKAQFMDERMASYFMEMAHDLSDTSWLDLAILEVDKEPASAYLSYRYGDRLYLYNSGYSPRFAKYSAGVALLAYRIHKAINQDLRYFDFLRGNEPYKYDFGGKDTYVYRALCEGEA